MPEFVLDTSGRVACEDPAQPCICHAATWGQLDAFAQGYIEAMFFTWPDDEGDYVGGITSPSFNELAPRALARILADCESFRQGVAFQAFTAWRGENEGAADDAQAGRDFWYTRCGHGVGFWDRDESYYGPHADALTAACGHGTAFPSIDPYLGDDGKAHLS